MRIAWLLALGGCLHSSAVTCPDDSLCPSGTACRQLTDPTENVCATPAQLDACAGLADSARCGTNGRCYSGVCIPIACGNGRVDRADPMTPGDVGEVCDDGNQVSGDGCSADCKSDETCGNGIVDSVNGEVCDDGNHIQHDGCDSACKPELPHWTQLTLDAPSDRFDLAMAYDASRGQTILFGGMDANGIELGDTWAWDGTSWTQLAPPMSPSPRSGHAMAYDAKHRRIVLFGGGTGASDTWVWDGTTWTAVPVLVSPPPRDNHRMAYDSAHERTILFGGFATGVTPPRLYADTWEWDGASWTQIAQDAPPSSSAAMGLAYDPVRDRTVMFDSVGDASTWELDDADDVRAWTKVSTSGPPERTETAMAYDPIAKRVMLFGGNDAGALGDAWEWTGAAWTQLTGSLPAARSGHAMATDLAHGQIVLFGGTPADELTSVWNGSAWRTYAPSPPHQQADVIVARDPVTSRTTLFGRNQQGGSTAETWTFDGAGLVQLPLATQPDPQPSVMAQDEARGVGVLLDVLDGITWTTNGTTWTKLAAVSPISAAVDVSLAYDADTRTTILLTATETWSWDGTTWTKLSPAHQPTSQGSASLAYDPIRRELVLFGGRDANSQPIDETWIWNGTDWVERSPAASPSARYNASLAWNASRGKLELFAGQANGAVADLWEWDGTSWQQIATANGPGPRFSVAMFPTQAGDGIVVFGGFTSSGSMAKTVGDLWQLRWDGSDPDETCRETVDSDGDKLAGCADPDCWATCTPECPPGSTCDPNAPRCGDGVCDAALENCHNCPGDCTCVPLCGDFSCDAPETAATCPGDCH